MTVRYYNSSELPEDLIQKHNLVPLFARDGKLLMGYELAGDARRDRDRPLLEYYPGQQRPYTVSRCNDDGYRRSNSFKSMDSAIQRLLPQSKGKSMDTQDILE